MPQEVFLGIGQGSRQGNPADPRFPQPFPLVMLDVSNTDAARDEGMGVSEVKPGMSLHD